MKIKLFFPLIVTMALTSNYLPAKSHASDIDEVLKLEYKDASSKALNAYIPSNTVTWIITSLKEILAVGAGYAAANSINNLNWGDYSQNRQSVAYFAAWGITNALLSAYLRYNTITDKLNALEKAVQVNILNGQGDIKFWSNVEKDLVNIYTKLSAASEFGDINQSFMYLAKTILRTLSAENITEFNSIMENKPLSSWLVTSLIGIIFVHDKFWISDKEFEKTRVLNLLRDVRKIQHSQVY